MTKKQIAERAREIDHCTIDALINRLATLAKYLNLAADALGSHECPDDGSIDTPCYPNNHVCPARILKGFILEELGKKGNVK